MGTVTLLGGRCELRLFREYSKPTTKAQAMPWNTAIKFTCNEPHVQTYASLFQGDENIACAWFGR